MKSFKELKVWEKSHILVLAIYQVKRKFPIEERFGLVSQVRRSASSIPTNIAEGFKRKSLKDYLHFLNLSESSLEETKYHLLLCKDLGYLDANNYCSINEKCEEIGKMLNGLQKGLSQKT